jgi:hypothetical protein
MSLMVVRLRDAWQFMASVMAAVLLVPMMGALFAHPRRAAGMAGAVAGFAGLIAFYGLLMTLGAYDVDQETYVWRVAGVEVWQDYAVLCTVPVSLVGYALGNMFGRRDA